MKEVKVFIEMSSYGYSAYMDDTPLGYSVIGEGKTVEEALGITNKAVMEALDGLPPVKVHCSLLAEEAIHAALWDYAEKNGIVIEGLKKPKHDIND